MAVKPGYLLLAGIGAVILWSGITGKSVTGVFRQLIGGQDPNSAASANQITQENVINPSSLSTSAGYGYGSGLGQGAGAQNPSAANAPSVASNYNHAQLMQLWRSVGGSSGTANNAACHAMQESSGNPNSTSPNPDGGTNVGLWQLDTPGGKGAGYTIAQLKNPILNAKVALKGSSGGSDWSAWATPGC